MNPRPRCGLTWRFRPIADSAAELRVISQVIPNQNLGDLNGVQGSALA